MIKFNTPPLVGTEIDFIKDLLKKHSNLCGDSEFSRKCQMWFEENFKFKKTLMTPSCTSALEMAALLIDIKPGDEVIVPSYTFVSTANAFVLRGAKIIFVDIREDTLNIDENCLEKAITPKTRAIVPVHYAGVSCEMDKIMTIAKKHNLFVIEDAAQGVMSSYKGKALGGIGHLGAFSFHETKNYTSGGEGGLLIINDEALIQRAEILREKGTNRSLFYKGVIDKYTWVDIGSSFLPSELQCAYLYAQLLEAKKINEFRLKIWNLYFKYLSELAPNIIRLPIIPEGCEHNAHMFYILLEDSLVRDNLINHLKKNSIQSVFHYVPLHSSIAGSKFGTFIGGDVNTTNLSARLLRLPLWYGMDLNNVEFICEKIKEFFGQINR